MYVCIYIYMCVYVYVYMCVCVYIYVRTYMTSILLEQYTVTYIKYTF